VLNVSRSEPFSLFSCDQFELIMTVNQAGSAVNLIKNQINYRNTDKT
jgi:hypothetical protein